MSLNDEFETKLKKIEMLNNFIILYGKKLNIVTDLSFLLNECNEIKTLLKSCSELLTQFHTESRKRFDQLTLKMQEQQTLMLEALEMEMETEMDIDRDERNTCAVIDANGKQLLHQNNLHEDIGPASVLKEMVDNAITPIKYGLIRSGDHTMMTISDYTKSPFASKRMRPVQLQFIDFERIISQDEFAKVPAYMKGRETLDDLQNFLETVIIQCFTAKYTLLPKRREAVATMEMDLWNLFKSQENYFKGTKFITQGDICRITDKQIDKKSGGRIIILRHLKIIREERKNSAICYIWCKN